MNNLKLYKVKVTYDFVILTNRKNDYALIEHFNKEIASEIIELGKFKFTEIKNIEDIPKHYLKEKPFGWCNNLISDKTTEEIFNRMIIFKTDEK